ncbi:MAG TPA: 3-deoxy-D-manno-octulosonic acid transferase, partial [Solirubrobacteraceae bacterium]
PSAVYRRLSRGVPLRLRQRLGYGPRRVGPKCGWIHAVSVGESIAAAPIVAGLRRHAPELPLVMTTVTETGARVVADRFRGDVVHRFFPLDFPGAARRAIEAINPAFVVCMETELWPNVLRTLARRAVPVMIANGRVSDRSYPRYRAVRRFLRPVLADVRVFAMQSETDARRIIALGAPVDRVFVTGNVKHEAAPPDEGAAEAWRQRLGLEAPAPVWIAGSTHRGEEELVLLAHDRARARVPGLTLIVAPRHPERAPEVLKLIHARGLDATLRSELPGGRRAGAVIVVDTVGELASIYALGDVVFVGGSLVAAGGHNVLEPALRGKPVLFGPHTLNFREPAELLIRGGGGRVVGDADELATALTRWLDDAALREAAGAAARAAAESRTGAVRETLDLIERFLLGSRA